MNNEVMLGLLRHALTVFGGILISKGVIDAANGELIIGSVMAIVGVIFSVKKNMK